MNAVGLAARQVQLEHRAFWRNPTAAFFTVVFPLLFMVVATVALAGRSGGPLDAARFYTPAVLCLALVTACYTNVAMGVVIARDAGILKRLRGTPLPLWAFIFGRAGQAVLVAALLVAIVAGYGAFVYGVTVPAGHLPAMAATLVLGAASFAALGVGVSSLVPNAAAAPAVVNATVLPLLLISDVLVPIEDPTLDAIARLFPVRHLAAALSAVYDPAAVALGLVPESLAVIGAWGVAGLVLVALTFSWQPRS